MQGRRTTGVRLKDGSVHRADFVISNAEAAYTYLNMIKPEHRRRNTDARYKTWTRYSMSLFVIYFGTKRRYTDSRLAHHNIILSQRYRGLLDDIFHRKVLAKDFSLYLHMPTITDPSLAPDGCEAFYVLSPVPHLGKAEIDWEVEGPRYRDRIFKYMEQRYIPDLRRDLVTSRIFTPADFKSVFDAHLGSAFSLEPILTQSAYFRVHNRDDRIRGLYFVGAGTHPGAGVPGVVASAKATASLILSDVGDRAGPAQ